MMNFLKSLISGFLKLILPPRRDGQKVIEAIHEDNLEDFLQKLGLLEDLRSGQLHCSSCNRVVDMNSIQCVFTHEGKIGFCCENQLCYEKMIEVREGESGHSRSC
jgi:hypothetical protein